MGEEVEGDRSIDSCRQITGSGIDKRTSERDRKRMLGEVERMNVRK